MGRRFHHLTYSDRLKIEALHMAKHTSQEIADQLGVHVSTIDYQEHFYQPDKTIQ